LQEIATWILQRCRAPIIFVEEGNLMVIIGAEHRDIIPGVYFSSFSISSDALILKNIVKTLIISLI
jgi:hypothetical protein